MSRMARPGLLSVGGRCNSLGFCLSIDLVHFLQEVAFETPEYAIGEVTDSASLDSLDYSIHDFRQFLYFIGSLFMLWLGFPLEFTSPWHIVSFGTGFSFMCIGTFGVVDHVILFYALTRKKPFAQWHALEHRMAILLEKGLYPTLDMLRTAPHISLRCGTILQFQAKAVIWSLGLGCWYSNWWFLLGMSAFLGASGFGYRPISRIMNIVLAVISFPSQIVGLLVQSLILTSTPSEKQMVHAEAAFREFILEHPDVAARLVLHI